MKKCPFCAEEVQDAAVKCRHCQRMIGEVEIGHVKETRGDSKPEPKKGKRWIVPTIGWFVVLIGVVMLFPPQQSVAGGMLTILSGVSLQNFVEGWMRKKWGFEFTGWKRGLTAAILFVIGSML